jgi:hypothetical protein
MLFWYVIYFQVRYAYSYVMVRTMGMMMSVLYKTNTLNFDFHTVHGNNIQRVDMSLHSDILSQFRSDKSNNILIMSTIYLQQISQ